MFPVLAHSFHAQPRSAWRLFSVFSHSPGRIACDKCAADHPAIWFILLLGQSVIAMGEDSRLAAPIDIVVQVPPGRPCLCLDKGR